MRRKRSAIWLLGALLLASACSGATHAEDALPAMQARLDAVVGQAIAEQRIVGAVVVVMKDGAVVHHRAYGQADREARRAATESTIFRLASCSKSFVSIAVLAMADHGSLSLDDPVTRWLPEFRPTLANGLAPTITIRQLLTHTAGLSYLFMEGDDGPYHREQVSTGLDQPGLSMQEELARIERAGLSFSPGTEWRYSVAIDVLGAVVAAAAEESLPEAIDTLVAKPLGLKSASFTVSDVTQLATPYYQADGRLLRMGDPQDVDFPGIGVVRFSPSRNLDATSFPSGGAGLSATAMDLAQLLDAVRSGGGKVLKPDSARSMLANQIGELTTVMGPGWGFGFGGAVLLDPEAAGTPQSKGTWVWSGVYGNSWFVDPVERLTVVALTNTAPEGDSGPFTLELRDAVYGSRASKSTAAVP